MTLNVIDAPREAKAKKRKAELAKFDLLPKVSHELLRCGLLNAILSLRSVRFRTYLKRPASLLNEHWTLALGEGKSSNGDIVSYTIQGAFGAVQTLSLDRVNRLIELHTECPALEISQTILYCVKKKRIVANECKRIPGRKK